MVTLLKIGNFLWVYIISGVLLAGFIYQLVTGEDPCPLCFLERLGMIGITIGILMNMRFGIRPEHYGIAIIASVVGRIISLRQIALHICPQSPPFGTPIFGFDLYVWAFIVFNCSVIVDAILLLMYGLGGLEKIAPFWNLGAKIAFWLVVGITATNFVMILRICGLSACS